MARNQKVRPESRKRQRFDDDALQEVLKKIKTKDISINKAAKSYGIPRPTLKNYGKSCVFF